MEYLVRAMEAYIERKEGSEKEHEPADANERKGRVSQRANKLHEIEFPWLRRQSRLHGDIGNEKHSQDCECGGSHRPSKSDLGDQFRHHNGKDNATQRRPRGHDSKSCCAPFEEPSANGAHSSIEDCACTNCAAYALGQEELVVLG